MTLPQYPPLETMSVQIKGLWYTVTKVDEGWYDAEIWGVRAAGNTPERAVRNAIRQHEPYTEIEE